MSSAPQGPYRAVLKDDYSGTVFFGEKRVFWFQDGLDAELEAERLNAAYYAGRESVMAVLRELEAAADQYRYSVEAHFPQNSKADTARLITAQLAADELLNPKPPTQ
jgi:hypothetical protein